MRGDILGLIALLAVPFVHGLECSKHDILKKYGDFKLGTSGATERDTPPSKTTERWWINPCEESKLDAPAGCEKTDMLCGITEVTLPDEKDKIVTQIIDFSKSIDYEVEETSESLIFKLKNTKWGTNTISASIEFVCDKNLKANEIVKNTWANQEIQISVKGPSGCLTDTDGDKNPDNGGKKPDNGDDNANKPSKSGTSWFTWLFLYAIMFTLIYLAIISYTTTRGGSFQDFREEFIERSTQLVFSLPTFLNEVIAKVLGRGESSLQRGGYSAV